MQQVPEILRALFLPVLAAALPLGAQTGPPVIAYSALSSADYSTTLAQGSLFVVFGQNMGPAAITSVTAFPLPSILAGTSVTVTSGATTLSCPMIYTSSGQLAAILPSNTPIGPASITVSYNNQTGPNGLNTTRATVVANSPGMYTTTSSGLGTGSFTALDGNLITFAAPAKPGQLLYGWGTGLGPINTPDNVLPPSFPNFPGVQVWVGSQAAAITYAGRSGCCSGVDQLAFTVPSVADSCNVPVTVVSGNGTSNTTTLPVSASGGPCSDSGPTLPTSLLTKAAAGQPVKLAAVALGSTAILGPGSEARAVADQLSRELHTRVPEADAARLLRAYRTRNAKAIRQALEPYAARWKALDAKTRSRIAAEVGGGVDSALAEFGIFSAAGVVANVTAAQFPPAGQCVILPNSVPFGLGSVSTGLDAGATLSLTGAAGSLTLDQVSKGKYQAALGNSGNGQSIPTGAYTISGSGGQDAGAFSATVNIASHLSISNKPALASVNPAQPLTVTWAGGTSGQYVLLGGGSTTPPHSYFSCAEDAGKGTFTIPSYIISAFNATGAVNGVIWIAANPLSNQIAIPGLDLAYFIDGSYDFANIAFPGQSALTDATNIVGTIDGLYPASGAAAARNGGMSTTGPVGFSALLTAGTFTASFDILPRAQPFSVVAVSQGGSATIRINPAQGTWEATYTVPTQATRVGDFSAAGFSVTDFVSNLPFPNNMVPESRLDPIALAAAAMLPLPNSATVIGANSLWSTSGVIPAGGHFTIESGNGPPGIFGGFVNLTTRGAQTADFSLFIDGVSVATRSVPFTTD